MKFLFSLLAIVVFTESCNSSKEIVSNSNESEQVEASKPSSENSTSKNDIIKDIYDKTIITYKALSRGTFEYVQVSKSKVITTTDRNLKIMDPHTCEAKDWDEISKLLKAVDVEHLDQLKAPTGKRLFDGAAHATLSITKGDVEIMTPSFDHGFPPKEIEALVNKVLSIKEKVSKQ